MLRLHWGAFGLFVAASALCGCFSPKVVRPLAWEASTFSGTRRFTLDSAVIVVKGGASEIYVLRSTYRFKSTLSALACDELLLKSADGRCYAISDRGMGSQGVAVSRQRAAAWETFRFDTRTHLLQLDWAGDALAVLPIQEPPRAETQAAGTGAEREREEEILRLWRTPSSLVRRECDGHLVPDPGRVEGRVTEVRGRAATICVGSDDGVQEGYEFAVIRDGACLGRIRINQVRPDESSGDSVPGPGRKGDNGGAGVRVNDIVFWHRGLAAASSGRD